MKHEIDGILLLDKPLDLTSNKALITIKKELNIAKAGHTGSLDPKATGLLPLCFGEATKFSSYLLNAKKTYTATGKLGFTSTTEDSEGEVTQISEKIISKKILQEVLQKFIGKSSQIPPIYSALKLNGKALYKYARKGQKIDDIKKREIEIYSLELLSFDFPNFVIDIEVSKGTYIRSVIRDIGENLSVGAYLTNLVRTKIENFNLVDAHNIDTVKNMSIDEFKSILIPLDKPLQHLDVIYLEKNQTLNIINGLKVDFVSQSGLYRLYSHLKIFIGLGCVENNILSASRLLNTTLVKIEE